jgi:hypothetical protein
MTGGISMMRSELEEVIVNFQEALKKRKVPDFNNNLHRVEQVLHILLVDRHNFEENEHKRACDPDTRKLWEEEWQQRNRQSS